VKAAAQELGLPVIQPRSARTGELRDAMVATGAELAVVVAYGKILPKPVLDALPRGCINVHGSLLPRYRGAAPVQWAVIHGDAETGVSIMQLDEGMDTGPVYLERRVATDPDETAGELLERLAPIGAQALLEVIAGLAAGTARAVAQDHAAASHAPMLARPTARSTSASRPPRSQRGSGASTRGRARTRRCAASRSSCSGRERAAESPRRGTPRRGPPRQDRRARTAAPGTAAPGPSWRSMPPERGSHVATAPW